MLFLPLTVVRSLAVIRSPFDCAVPKNSLNTPCFSDQYSCPMYYQDYLYINQNASFLYPHEFPASDADIPVSEINLCCGAQSLISSIILLMFSLKFVLYFNSFEWEFLLNKYIRRSFRCFLLRCVLIGLQCFWDNRKTKRSPVSKWGVYSQWYFNQGRCWKHKPWIWKGQAGIGTIRTD